MSKIMKLQTGYRVSFDAYVPPPPTLPTDPPPVVPQNFYAVRFMGSPNTIKYVVNNVIYNYGDTVVFPVNYFINYVSTALGKEVVFGSYTVIDNHDIVVNLADANNIGPGAVMIIKSTPTSADIKLNASPYGITTSTITPPLGNYNLTVSSSGFADYAANYTLTAGMLIELTVTLNPAYPAAGIYVDSSCVGTDRYNRYTDGTGGYYQTLAEANATSCGYVSSTYLFHAYRPNPKPGDLPPRGTVRGSANDGAALAFQREMPFTLELKPGPYVFISDESPGDYPQGGPMPANQASFTVLNVRTAVGNAGYTYRSSIDTVKTYYIRFYAGHHSNTEAKLFLYTNTVPNSTLKNVTITYYEYDNGSGLYFSGFDLYDSYDNFVNSVAPIYRTNNIPSGIDTVSLSGIIGRDSVVSLINTSLLYNNTTPGAAATFSKGMISDDDYISMRVTTPTSWNNNPIAELGIQFDVTLREQIPGSFFITND